MTAIAFASKLSKAGLIMMLLGVGVIALPIVGIVLFLGFLILRAAFS